MSLTDELGMATKSPHWQAVGIIFDAENRSSIRPKDLALQLYTQAYMWFHKLLVFRQGEMTFMYEGTPTEDMLQDHRLFLDNLIQEAEEICRRIQGSGELIKPENGFTLEDLKAAIEDLRNTKLQWHGSMGKARKSEILSRVFDIQKS